MARAIFSRQPCSFLFLLISGLALLLPNTGIASNVLPDGSAFFLVSCDYSHSLEDDPIVRPDEPGESHLHEFFGNIGTNAYTKSTDLRTNGAGTTCKRVNLDENHRIDHSAYWLPALLRNGARVDIGNVGAYYTTNRKVNSTLEIIPENLIMIAGNHPSQPEALSWNCGSGTPLSQTIPDCTGGGSVIMHIRFPDCWDGKNLDSEDHRSHMAYAVWQGSGKVCPPGYPHPIPRLILRAHFDTDGDPANEYNLVSDLSHGHGHSGSDTVAPGSTGHADFMNGFDQDELELLIDVCLRSSRGCGHRQRPRTVLPGQN